MFYKKIFLLLVLIALLVTGCGSGAVSAPTLTPAVIPVAATTPTPAVTATPAPAPIKFTDSAGRQVTLAGIPQRIISLAPSTTEILFALDLGSQVVGADDFSDFPSEAKTLTKIGGSGNKYNFEQIVALKPNLILAASITSQENIKKLDDLKLPVAIVGVTNTTFDGVFADIALVGQMTGRTDKAKSVTDAMKQKMDAVKVKTATAKTKPRVYWELDSTDPTKPFSVGPGNFVNDIIVLAGGTNVFGNASKAYPQVSSEQVVSANPEVIIMSDAAYGVSVDSLTKRKGWQVVAAVKNKNVHPIEDSLVSRPGPRIVDGLEAAAKLIHPELFK